MTIYEKIKGHMERLPAARERAKKNKFIAWILDNSYHLTVAGIEKAAIENLVKDVLSYDRAWRQVLQHEPNLRGKDYDDKLVLEQERELELGYQPKIPQDDMVKSI